MTVSVKERDRIDQRFELWDRNHNGRIERSDFDVEARDILRRFNESEQTPKGKRLLNAYLGMWDTIAQQAGVGKNGALTKDQFKQTIEQHMLERGSSGFQQILRPSIQAIVEVCDTDGDGEVSPKEFTRWTDAIGVDRSHAQEAFREIDTNGDGRLSVDELVEAVRAYHAGEIDAPLLGA